MTATLPAVAEHRPAVKRRRFAHDDLIAVDLFSGFGGLTQGIERAGFTTIMAANHKRYKVEVHEANHPHAEHWIADLVDPESSDYHSARDLPPADLLAAGVSCVNHSAANTKKAYSQGLSLFDLEDPDFEGAVTKSERDRATANCVLHYAAAHHPRLILVECTTELTSWGEQVPGKKKVADGSTYRWWLNQFELLGYRYRVLYLNSMFFGVGIGLWVEKAWREHETCDGIAMLLPANRTEQGWWQYMVEPFRDRDNSALSVLFLPGRMRFIAAGQTAVGPNERPPFGCCLLTWGLDNSGLKIREQLEFEASEES